MAIIWKNTDNADNPTYPGKVLEYPISERYDGGRTWLYARVQSAPEVGPIGYTLVEVGYMYPHERPVLAADVTVDATSEVTAHYQDYLSWQKIQRQERQSEHDRNIPREGKKMRIASGRKCKGDTLVIEKIYSGNYGPYVRHKGQIIACKHLIAAD